MSKAKFAAAKELINEKDYVGARAILKGIDHPTAREWERKLDSLNPTPKKQRYTPKRTIILIAAVLVTIALIIIVLLGQSNSSGEKGTVSARLFGYCLDVYVEVRDSGSMDNCSGWSAEIEQSYQFEKVMACHRQSPELDKPFHDCLVDEEILPPGVISR